MKHAACGCRSLIRVWKITAAGVAMMIGVSVGTLQQALYAGGQDQTTVSFRRDIEAIFTRHGCNTAECHGGVKGKGGFKLSLNGQNPREDHRWIVRGGVFQVLTDEVGRPQRPRVQINTPERSLLLRKPTLTEDHEGGQLFNVGSADYETLRRWIADGAPFDQQPDASPVTELRVSPSFGVLDRDGQSQIRVTARYAGGRDEDITDGVSYLSSNPEVIRVDSHGRVRAVASGEAFVLVRATGRTGSARFAVVTSRGADYPNVPRNTLIDEHIFGKLSALRMVPSELADDAEFLRRACLSLTGTLPPPQRVREFLADPDPAKREALIEILLDTPEYIDYWTFRLGQLFRVRGGSHPEHGYSYWHWLRDGLTSNKPFDQLARERISAQGYQGPSRHLPTDDFNSADLMAEDVRVFWGRRLDCAQCHDHPFESWTQQQFWGLAAFYGKLNRTDWPGFAATVLFDDPAGPDPDYGSPVETVRVINPRTRVEMQPTFLNGEVLPDDDRRSDPRLYLAEWMTAQPYFAEATVNRMWSCFFGRGLVEPVDDFRSDNPPSHPELLQALADDFREHHYDMKRLVRLIVTSRTFQLSSMPNATNRDDQANYSHFIPRQLEPEVLLDAISQVTGVPQNFENSQGGTAPPGTRAVQLVVPDIYKSRFLEVYGSQSRERLPEARGTANLSQALHMLVGDTYTERLSEAGSRVERWLQSEAADDEIVEELYLAALSRFPSATERESLGEMIRRQSSRDQALKDLLWAFVASREFASNH